MRIMMGCWCMLRTSRRSEERRDPLREERRRRTREGRGGEQPKAEIYEQVVFVLVSLRRGVFVVVFSVVKKKNKKFKTDFPADP